MIKLPPVPGHIIESREDIEKLKAEEAKLLKDNIDAIALEEQIASLTADRNYPISVVSKLQDKLAKYEQRTYREQELANKRREVQRAQTQLQQSEREYFVELLADHEGRLVSQAREALRVLGALQRCAGIRSEPASFWDKSTPVTPGMSDTHAAMAMEKELLAEFNTAKPVLKLKAS